jgi:hypothetical protein
MLTTENCVDHMMNLAGCVKGKTAVKDQYSDLLINYFFVAISIIKVQGCLYRAKLYIFFGSANLGNKTKDILV